MRNFKLCVLAVLVCSAAAAPAYACRELVKFEPHLTGESPGWFRFYHVVTVLAVRDEGLLGRIDKTFGDQSLVGTTVDFRFVPNEEPHAVCPVAYAVGATFLLYSSNTAPPFTISRFNGYNMPQAHAKFWIYVSDLDQASAANQRLERP